MVAVVGSSGRPLDPTTEYRTRKLLKAGKAVIYRYRPIFTIRLTNREGGVTHPIEYKTGGPSTWGYPSAMSTMK